MGIPLDFNRRRLRSEGANLAFGPTILRSLVPILHRDAADGPSGELTPRRKQEGMLEREGRFEGYNIEISIPRPLSDESSTIELK